MTSGTTGGDHLEQFRNEEQSPVNLPRVSGTGHPTVKTADALADRWSQILTLSGKPEDEDAATVVPWSGRKSEPGRVNDGGEGQDTERNEGSTESRYPS